LYLRVRAARRKPGGGIFGKGFRMGAGEGTGGDWPRGVLLSAAFAEFGAKRAAEKAD